MRISVPVSDDLEQTLRVFGELIEEHAAAPAPDAEGTGNFRCEHCVACNDCRFCTECENCRECTYCYGCRDCLGLTQCRQCDASEKLSHSDLCGECIGGSYLTLCLDCEDCVQCFGCVGLAREEFCILNEKLSRKEYFARVKELRRQLEVRTRDGWLPPWRDDRESEDDAVAPPKLVLEHRADEPSADVPSPDALTRAALGRETIPRRSSPSRRDPAAPAVRRDDAAERATTGQWRAATDGPPRTVERPDVVADHKLPPFPELPDDLDDSGLWTGPEEDIPPPPPYSGRATLTQPSSGDSSRISISAEALPTLTRGSRPKHDKPAAATPRASVRRGRPPPRR